VGVKIINTHALSFCVYIYFTCFHSLSPFFELTLYKRIFHKRLALLLGLLLHCTDCTSYALTLFSYRQRSHRRVLNFQPFVFRCPRARPSASRYVKRERESGTRSVPHSYSPVFSLQDRYFF